MTRSLSIAEKIDLMLGDKSIVNEAMEIVQDAISTVKFCSEDDLAKHLREGASLYISKMASNALSIPSGNYLVWASDDKHTMLVPAPDSHIDVFESEFKPREVFTGDLLSAYDSIGRVLSEEDSREDSREDYQQNEDDDDEGDEEGVRDTVDAGSVDRQQMLRAMEQRGLGVSELADLVGVQPPAISRVLRRPKRKQGDPLGRNPSIGLASKLSQALRTNVESLFPDIFSGSRQAEPRGNKRGVSGGKGAGSKRAKATEKWTAGNAE